MKKKRILHMIFNLGRGGAETMLVTVIKELPEYEHVVLTLFSKNDFGEELVCDRLISMNLTLPQLINIPGIASKMGALVREVQPDLVHTHLFWPTVLARLSVPKHIPMITTVHAFASQLVDYRKWYFKKLEQYTYKKRPTTIIAVAQGALEDYYRFLKHKPGKNYCLYTFVDLRRFTPLTLPEHRPGQMLKLVSVGALRYQKNQIFLIEAFKKLKHLPVQLDIYGEGPMRNELESALAESKVNITLKGQSNKIEEKLGEYHAFVMSSHYEGFSLGVLEAMALQIPLLLSDIPSFREQCDDDAIYFPLNETDTFVQTIQSLINDSSSLAPMAANARKRVEHHFTLPHHVEKLKAIYASELYAENV